MYTKYAIIDIVRDEKNKSLKELYAMKIKINGKRFANYEDANAYLMELTSEENEKVVEAIRTIIAYCDKHKCENCVLCDGDCAFCYTGNPTTWTAQTTIYDLVADGE